MNKLSFSVLSSLLLIGCDTSSGVPAGRIRVKNDFYGKQYTTIRVAGGGTSFTLGSKESALMPPGTYKLNFSYTDDKSIREYTVKCPTDLKKGITINLLDVHLNTIAGGCETVWANKR